MGPDPLDLYDRASAWTLANVPDAATKLDAPTPCDDWDVRTLMNHMLDTSRYFAGVALAEDPSPPSPIPPQVLGENPVADFERARGETMRVYAEPGVIEKTGPSLGIAFSDQLLHGWDLARATSQDATMPDPLPEAAYQAIHGLFTEEQRRGVFEPELPVRDDPTPQERLLAYTGRSPA